MQVIAGAKTDAKFFKTQLGTSSGPGLLRFSVFISVSTKAGSKLSGMLGKSSGKINGDSEVD